MTIVPGQFLSYHPRKRNALDNRHFDVVVIERGPKDKWRVCERYGKRMWCVRPFRLYDQPRLI
jgi:hypothetical protein